MGLLISDTGSKDISYPKAFGWLRVSRLIMFFLLSTAHLFAVPQIALGQKVFVVTALIVFTVNHFLYFTNSFDRFFLLLISVDFVVSAAFGVVFPSNINLYLIFFGVISVTLFLGTDSRKILSAFALLFFITWGVILNYTYRQVGHIDWINNIISMSFVVHGCLVGALIRFLQRARLTIADQFIKLDDSHTALQDAHDQLQSYAQQVEDLTVTRERNHIAREIHDTVGHTMTAMLVQLQAAQMLLEHEPTQSAKTLKICEELARSALQEVRLSVRALREEEGAHHTPVESLRKLLADFAEMSGLACSLHSNGDPSSISAALQPTIYRVVQEALTNAKRHGNATQVTVELACSDTAIHIDITDDGEGTGAVTPGFGLANMRERIMERGGSIQFVSEKGAGFSVKVHIPLRQQSWQFGGASA